MKCENLEQVRENIDRIDNEIIKLIAERGTYVVQASAFKKDEEGVYRLVENDNSRVYTLAEIAYVLYENKSTLLQEKCGITDEERIKYLKEVLSGENIKNIKSITAEGYASAHGYVETNKELGKNRAHTAANWFIDTLNLSITPQVTFKSDGNNIGTKDETDIVEISLIGFYQGKMKGVDTAIRALSKLPENFRLNILGNGTQKSRDHWYDYASSLGIKNPKNRITFPAPLPNATAVLEWLDTQDFFVLPTRSEGFGRCVAEAMSRGCVCFATDICTMPELLEKECLHPLGDGDRLAELILKYNTDKELMKANAKRNFEKAKEYDFEILRERRNKFLNQFKEYCERQNQK